MIEQLFGSKTRVKLLSLFFNNPNRPFYVREITRKIDEQINSVRRELSNLLSIGIIKSDSANNRLYYEVNQKYEFYPQLRGIFTGMVVKSKDSGELKEEEQIAKKLRSTGTVDLAFLTGNYVRDSRVSIDILVVGDVNRAKFAKVVNELEQEMGKELNYAIFGCDEYQYRISLNDRFLTNVLDAKKILLIDNIHDGKSAGSKDAQPVEVKVDANDKITK